MAIGGATLCVEVRENEQRDMCSILRRNIAISYVGGSCVGVKKILDRKKKVLYGFLKLFLYSVMKIDTGGKELGELTFGARGTRSAQRVWRTISI